MRIIIYLLCLLAIFSVKFSSGQVIFIFFNGVQSALINKIELTWQSATETNMDYYTIERSIDSVSYNSVGTIMASGNSNYPISYLYIDSCAFADTCYYYRLKATNYDAFYQYSDTIIVCYNSASSVAEITVNLFSNIYPNPVIQGLLNIELIEYKNCIVNIFNQFGQIVLSTKILTSKTAIDCSNFNSGQYFLQLIKSNGQSGSEIFIVE